jgi:hypothetical protein
MPRTFQIVHPLGWTIWKGEILPRPKKSFSPEYKDEAVKMVIETSRPIARIAKELGINEGTLGNPRPSNACALRNCLGVLDALRAAGQLYSSAEEGPGWLRSSLAEPAPAWV